jgi:hypothetical protein
MLIEYTNVSTNDYLLNYCVFQLQLQPIQFLLRFQLQPIQILLLLLLRFQLQLQR